MGRFHGTRHVYRADLDRFQWQRQGCHRSIHGNGTQRDDGLTEKLVGREEIFIVDTDHQQIVVIVACLGREMRGQTQRRSTIALDRKNYVAPRRGFFSLSVVHVYQFGLSLYVQSKLIRIHSQSYTYQFDLFVPGRVQGSPLGIALEHLLHIVHPA